MTSTAKDCISGTPGCSTSRRPAGSSCSCAGRIGPATTGKVERSNGYPKGSFLVPLKASLKAGRLTLDLDTANRVVLLWLEEVADRRVHATTGVEPYRRLPEDRAHLQPLPRGLDAKRVLTERRPRTALPIQSLQHPLSVYQSLLEVAA